jgi:hypothetical protein
MPTLTDLARIQPQTARAMPPLTQVAKAGIVSVIGSVIASVVLASIGQVSFSYPKEFDKFTPPGYIALTVIGVLAATLAWPVVTRLTASPRWLFSRLAVVVTVVLLLPDFWLLTQAGNPLGPVVMLMVMHLAIAAITYPALVLLAPAPQASRS